MIPKRPDRKECLDDLGFRVYRTEVIAHEHAVAKVAVEALRAEVITNCECSPEYRGRDLQDPQCRYCDQEELREALAKIEASGWKP